MWHLAKLSVNNRLVTIIAAVILAAGSIWALLSLKVELIPNIEFPYTTVVTIYPDAAPETVVKDVTAPIEKVVWDNWSGRGLKHLTSTSSKGMSLIMCEFEFGTPMDKVSQSINDGIKQLALPSSVADFARLSNGVNPQIIPINMNLLPVEELSLRGNLPADQLKQLADTQVVPKLKALKGVVRVDTEGGHVDQIIVSPDPALMNKYGISTSQIAAAVGVQYRSIDEVGATPLGTGSVRLSDVARITQGPPPLSTITRTNGVPSVNISVAKADTANTVEVASAVNEQVKSLQGKLGDGVQLSAVFDQSVYITNSVSGLWEKAIVGAALAIAVVFLFLWAIRASLVTAVSIPLSVLLGFLGMRMAGITINLLTLSAMSIAIGRLIDDSIVMVEVIFRRLKRGEDFKEAAVGGAKEVANPITTATLATVAIFVPMLFVGGIVGEMFMPFALTVVFAMIASLLVALLVVPALSRFLLSRKPRPQPVRDNWYQKLYLRTLRWALLHRALVIVLAVVLFIGSLGLVPLVGTSFMSGMSDKTITISIQMPANTEITATSAVAAKVEQLLTGNKAIKNYSTNVGTGTSMAGIMSAASGGGTNTATINLYLNSDADLRKETDSIIQACQKIQGGAVIEVANSESGGGGSMGMGGAGVNISVAGVNQDQVASVANQLVDQLKKVNGITNLASDITTVSPQLTIAVNPVKAVSLGLGAAQMAQLQQEFYYLMVGGTVPGRTTSVDSQDYSVYIQGVAQGLDSVQQAQNLKIGFPQSITLGDIADITIQDLPSHISRTDTFLSASITGAVSDRNVGAVNQAIQRQIDALPAQTGVEVKMKGVAEQMKETFSRMGIAIVAAIIIVFLIVILMMRSIRNPLMIMVSLPLASIGAFIALAISRYTLSVSAMMGLLMLVGIVLTNAIVLVTLVESLRKSGLSTQESLLEGGKIRLRPILMTALTTIFAMVPMAVGWGSGAMLTAELAVVVIGGLFSSTLLTLLVIPAIYSLAHDRRRNVAPKIAE